MSQMSGMDYMFFGFENEENPIHIAGTSLCDAATAPGGEVKGSEVWELLCDRLGSLPLVRRRLQRVPFNLDYPYWVDDEKFDLDYHVRLIRLPKPGNWNQLTNELAGLINEPFDMNRPLWELYVIEGINEAPDLSKGSFALYLRLHHVFADAATSMIINDVMYDDSSYAPASNENREAAPGTLRMLGSAAWNSMGRSLNAGLDLVRATPSTSRYLAETISHSVRERVSPLEGLSPPRTQLNPKRMTNERLADARRFDFQSVRQMRQLIEGSTINDLLLAIISGGIRRYLANVGEEMSETLTTVVPINLRKFDDSGDGSNVVSGMTLPLCQNIEDPVERLRAIREASARAKGDIAMEVNRRAVGLVTGLPLPVLGITLSAFNKLAYRSEMLVASTIISNARSFSEIRFVGGAEVKYAFGVGMLAPGVGALHACTVYAGYLNIGLTCSPNAIPETGEYMRCIEDSFAEYDALASA